MSELLDKQVNPQKENLKKMLSGFTRAPTSPQKGAMKVETRKKRWAPKMFLLGGRSS